MLLTSQPLVEEDSVGPLKHLCERLRDLLDRASGVVGPIGDISQLCPRKPVIDDVAKLLIRGNNGNPTAVALCSATASPGLVERALANAARARELLGPVLGAHVPVPLVTGEIEGRSFAVLPYFWPLADSRWR